ANAIMEVKRLCLALTTVGVLLPLAAGGEPGGKGAKADYTELSRLIHKVMVSQMPKVIEDDSEWGKTVPVPPKLPLAGMRKTVVVGNRKELPHGLWQKMRVWMDDPARDLTVRVRDLKSVDGKAFRLSLDADAAVHTQTETQHWQKGLALVGFTAQAD